MEDPSEESFPMHSRLYPSSETIFSLEIPPAKRFNVDNAQKSGVVRNINKKKDDGFIFSREIWFGISSELLHKKYQ